MAPVNESQTIYAKISLEDRRRLNRIMKEQDSSLSRIFRIAIRNYLDKYDQENPPDESED